MKYNKDKLGTHNPKYWSNISDYKPINWKVVDGKKRIYSNSVDIVYSNGVKRKYIDTFEIQYHVDYKRELNLSINNNNNVIKFLLDNNLEISHFYRDTLPFPFPESLICYSEDDIKKYKQLRKQEERKIKIKNLINGNRRK